jgi:uncharacterized membrane-anchored protein YhcB (DUF1043 family)
MIDWMIVFIAFVVGVAGGIIFTCLQQEEKETKKEN